MNIIKKYKDQNTYYTCPDCLTIHTDREWDKATQKDFGGDIASINDSYNNKKEACFHTCPVCDRASSIENIKILKLIREEE